MREFTERVEALAKYGGLRSSSTAIANSQEFLDEHRNELLEKHGEKWIAVFYEDVVAVNDDLTALISVLREKGLPLQHISVDRLSRQEKPIIV